MKLIEGAIDFGDADEVRVDGISGVYRLSEHTICVEMYANKIVDVQKVMVLRNTWDRSSWLEAQAFSLECSGRSPPSPVPATATRRCVHKRAHDDEARRVATNEIARDGRRSSRRLMAISAAAPATSNITRRARRRMRARTSI
jgi:hypothetical protein